MKHRTQDWTQEQIALLIAMYPTNPLQEIIAATGRSKEGVYAKAQALKLSRANSSKFKPGNTAGVGRVRRREPSAIFKITSRDLVLGEFLRNPSQTTKSLSAATGVRRSGCWMICNDLVKKGLAHISGWVCSKETNWNKEATFTYGSGESLAWTPRQNKAEGDPFEILPVPRPPIGIWGLCWPNTTTPAQQAEMNTA